jgi:hypothetical protein
MAKSKAAQELGARGGKAGRGKSKVRGDAEYYRKMVAKRWAKRKKPQTVKGGR